jgi:hypothetical protein
MPPPENAPLRMLLIEKADQDTEGKGRSPQQKAALTRLKTEMEKQGVLVSSVRLQPSSKAKRLLFTNNKLQVLDGPFAESKELIGGFAILELADMEEAVATCRPYAEILGGTVEIDIRVVDQDEAAA